MLRLSTLFWALIAVAVGLFLYQVKHEVQGLEQQLARTNRAIGAAHERIHVLHAEWSLLNEPDRLRALATRHLDLVPMRPAQFAQAQAIAALPPAVRPSAVAEATTQPAQVAPVVASAQRAPDASPRVVIQREEPLPRPRQAAPQPRRELEAAAPRPLMPPAVSAGVPAGAAAALARQQPMPVIAVSAAPPPMARPPASSSLGAPAAALPPPVPRVVGGN